MGGVWFRFRIFLANRLLKVGLLVFHLGGNMRLIKAAKWICPELTRQGRHAADSGTVRA
jgi:hypothetical protein